MKHKEDKTIHSASHSTLRVSDSMSSVSTICQNCKADFIITPNDFGFYEKIQVPPPTFCPDCRRQRRWSWRNNMSLYNRKCELCDKSVISIYSPDTGLTIYCNKCWWSDKWDPKSYGIDYDFSRPFFTQYRELIQKVPHMSVVNDDGIASLNCEYTHDWWFSKNCYMCFSGWNVENVMYSSFILQGKEIVDCFIIRSKSERMYECVLTNGCYNVKYSNVSKSCIDSQFIYDCIDCQDCLMSCGLRGKKYFYKNKKYSKEEYEKILKSYQLDTFSGVEKAQKEYDEFILNHPRRHALLFRTTNSSGDVVSDSKNVKNSFVAKNCENVSYSDFAGDAKNQDKDCYDLTLCGGLSESYECVVGDHSQLNLFALFSVKSQDLRYNQHCHNCKYIFGCVGLRNAKYCIFNKQYTKEEYEELLPKLIQHMNDMPYMDKKGNVYRYGEFYPTELSYFGYNETSANEEYPLSKEKALSMGYSWQDNLQRTIGKETLDIDKISESINDIDDEILNEVLICMECQRNYKIVQNELIFYKRMNIPIPRRCPHCRHARRSKRGNGFRLWHRQCMCELENHNHIGQCVNEFETPYNPERKEIVYCEKCYQQEVY